MADSKRLSVSINKYQVFEETNIVVYCIQVQYGTLRWEVSRRFSDFVNLYDGLKANGYAALPLLPSKTIFAHTSDPRFLTRRKNKLFDFLTELTRRPDIRNSSDLYTFLEILERVGVPKSIVVPVLTANTGPQKFAVSCIANGVDNNVLVASYEDKTAVSTLGRLWTLIEPDELGAIKAWRYDPSHSTLSEIYGETLSCKARCLDIHKDTQKILLGLDDGKIQLYAIKDDRVVKKDKIDTHGGVIMDIFMGSGISPIGVSVGADGSLRILDVVTESVQSGGRLKRRLGEHNLTACVLQQDMDLVYLGTSAGHILVYSIHSNPPEFAHDILLQPADPIKCLAIDNTHLFASHGSHVSCLNISNLRTKESGSPKRPNKEAIFTLNSNPEYVRSMAVSQDGKRLFVGYETFVAWWDIQKCNCICAWNAHNGGVHQVLLFCKEQYLITGGDSGSIKVWRLPAINDMIVWDDQPGTSTLNTKESSGTVLLVPESNDSEDETPQSNYENNNNNNLVSSTTEYCTRLVNHHSSDDDSDDEIPVHLRHSAAGVASWKASKTPKVLDRNSEKIERDFKPSERNFETIDRNFEASERNYETIERDFESPERNFETIDRNFEASERNFQASKGESEAPFLKRMDSSDDEYLDDIRSALT